MLGKFTEVAGSSEETHATAGGSVIADDLVVEGVIVAKGAVEIRGRVNGDVDGQAVVVVAQATVRGDIRGDRIEIDGSVEGDISGGDVSLSPAAQVKGSITYRDLTIQSGATVNGQVRHAAPKPEAAPKPQAKGSSSE